MSGTRNAVLTGSVLVGIWTVFDENGLPVQTVQTQHPLDFSLGEKKKLVAEERAAAAMSACINGRNDLIKSLAGEATSNGKTAKAATKKVAASAPVSTGRRGRPKGSKNKVTVEDV